MLLDALQFYDQVGRKIIRDGCVGVERGVMTVELIEGFPTTCLNVLRYGLPSGLPVSLAESVGNPAMEFIRFFDYL